MPKFVPDLIIGSCYGDWTVLEERPRPREKYYLCKCKCGKEKEVSKASLRNGGSTSCNTGACKKKYTTHNQSNSKLYKVWANIRKRVSNPTGKNKCYKGLQIATEWQSFEPFYKWAMTNGYQEGLTIDRIDTDIGYTPDNCRWVDYVVQSQNRRKHSTGKQEPKGVYLRKPRNGKVLYAGTYAAPYYWIVIYKGKRHQKSGFTSVEDAYRDRCKFIKDNYDGLVYPD